MPGSFFSHFNCFNSFNCFRRVNSVQVSEPSDNHVNLEEHFTDVNLGSNIIFPRPIVHNSNNLIDFKCNDSMGIIYPDFLSSFVKLVKGNDDGVSCSLWTDVKLEFERKKNKEISRFTPFISFLIKLTSTEHLPKGYDDDQWPRLKENLVLLFNKMEQEYFHFDGEISKCEFINQIIGISEESVITCIDKVKLGYLYMQILTKNNAESNLFIIDSIIRFIEDIGSAKVVFDKESNRFIGVVSFMMESSKFSLRLKFLVKFFHALDSGNTELYEDLLKELRDYSDLMHVYNYDKNTLLQVFILPALIEKYPHMRVIDMTVNGKDDYVQDILFYAYQRLDDRFHKLLRHYSPVLINGIDGQLNDGINSFLDESLNQNEKVSS